MILQKILSEGVEHRGSSSFLKKIIQLSRGIYIFENFPDEVCGGDERIALGGIIKI